MSELFDILKPRFETDLAIVASCRRMYEGVEGQRFKVLPHLVLVVGEAVPTDSFTSDIDEITFELQAWARDITTKGITKMVKDIRRVFDDAALESSAMSFSGLERLGTSGLELDDGRYKAVVRYRCFAQQKNNSPVVRAN